MNLDEGYTSVHCPISCDFWRLEIFPNKKGRAVLLTIHLGKELLKRPGTCGTGSHSWANLEISPTMVFSVCLVYFSWEIKDHIFDLTGSWSDSVPALRLRKVLEVGKAGSGQCLRPWLSHGLHFCISFLFHFLILYYFKLQTQGIVTVENTQTM